MNHLPASRRRSSRSRDLLRGLNLILKNPLTTFGLALIFALILTALFAPYLAPYPDQGKGQSNLGERLLAPALKHPLGTDNLGRDILSRIIFGARTSLMIGVVAVGTAAIVGIILGRCDSGRQREK